MSRLYVISRAHKFMHLHINFAKLCSMLIARWLRNPFQGTMVKYVKFFFLPIWLFYFITHIHNVDININLHFLLKYYEKNQFNEKCINLYFFSFKCMGIFAYLKIAHDFLIFLILFCSAYQCIFYQFFNVKMHAYLSILRALNYEPWL